MKNFNGLIEFVSVVENGGFTAAAKVLGASPSYVSRRIAALEERLGAKLLHRSTRRVKLTEIGAQYFEKAADLLHRFEDLETALADQHNLVIGDIRVTAGGKFGETEVASALADFALAHPQLRVFFHISTRRADLIEEGFDLAIRHETPGDPELIARKLTSRRMVVCATPEYLDKFGRPSVPDDLHGHHCLASGHVPWLFQVGEANHELKMQGRWSSNNGEALVQAALRSLGLARLAEIYVQDAVAAGRLEIVLEDYELPPSTTYLVYPSREYIPYRLRVLIDFLVDRLG